MSMQGKILAIRTNTDDPESYREQLRDAVLEVLQLVFERHSLDLDARETYALFLLTDLARNCQVVDHG